MTGSPVHVQAWRSPEPVATLVVSHGLGEHIGRYEALAAYLVGEMRIDCVGNDHRGFGRSPGRRGDIDSFDTYVRDLADLVAAERSRNPPLPLFLLGHSMGGVVALRYAAQDAELSGLLLSAPAVAPNNLPRPWIVSLLSGLARAAPRLTASARISPERLSRDQAIQKAYLADEQIVHSVTLRWLRQFERGRGEALASAWEIRTPILILHGDEDDLVSADGSRSILEAVGSTDKELRVLQELRHEVLNGDEQQRDDVFRQLAEWIHARA